MNVLRFCLPCDSSCISPDPKMLPWPGREASCPQLAAGTGTLLAYTVSSSVWGPPRVALEELLGCPAVLQHFEHLFEAACVPSELTEPPAPGSSVLAVCCYRDAGGTIPVGSAPPCTSVCLQAKNLRALWQAKHDLLRLHPQLDVSQLFARRHVALSA